MEKYVSVDRRLESGEYIEIRAERVRMERSGTHALVSIWLTSDGKGPVILASDNFNVERDSDRVRLANSAGKQMGAVSGALYPPSHMKHDLDIFSRGLWNKWLGQIEIGPVHGATEYAPPQSLLTPYVLAGAGTILFGSPGSGKSWLGMLMAVSMDAAVETLWRTESTPALYINLERSAESLRQRLGQVNHVLGMDRDRPLSMINARGRRLGAVIDRIQQYIESAEIGVVILDSISRASGGGSLTTDDTANTIMDTLNSIGITWLAIGHTSRETNSHVFGSQMFDAAADVTVAVNAERKGETLGIALRVTMTKDISFPPPETLALEFGENGLEGVRTANTYEFPQLEAERKLTPMERVYIHLGEVGEDTSSNMAKVLGVDRSNLSRQCSHDLGLLSDRRGHEIYYRLSPEVGSV